MSEPDEVPTISPEPILKHAYGFWASAILAAAIKHEIFRHLDLGPCTAAQLAQRSGISERGAQAILDGLLGMQLVEGNVTGYRNAAASSAYLIPGKADYLGGYADMILSTFGDWTSLTGSVLTGEPLHRHENANPANAFWEPLVTALAPLGFAPARAAARLVGIERMQSGRTLDVGGGAGAWSATWLGLNPTLSCDQIDWPNVNPIARSFVAQLADASRFTTLDGDMETADLGDGAYDAVVYANVAHGLSGSRNTAMFRRIRRALKPTGKLVICGLVPSAERTGAPLLLLFHANMLLNTDAGSIHTKAEYERWLADAGFTSLSFHSIDGLPLSLIVAS